MSGYKEASAPTRRGTRTINRILDAAARLFGRDGFQGASMHAVAQAAGVSKGLLHYHFRSKEHLLIEAQRATFRQIHARFEDRVARGERGLTPTLETLDALWHSIRDMRSWTPFYVETLSLSHTEEALRSDLDGFYSETLQLLENGIREAMESGDQQLLIPSDRVANIIHCAFHGLIVELSLAESDEDLARIDQTYADMRRIGEHFLLEP